jgi:hypothetical protein
MEYSTSDPVKNLTLVKIITMPQAGHYSWW